MIELKLYVSEIDYDSVIRNLSGGGMAGAAAAMAARALSDEAKEELAVKYLNSSAAKLQDMLESAAANKGIVLHVTGAKAAVVREAADQ